MNITRKLMLRGWQGHPEVECMVEIWFDPDVLARDLGERAFRNKSKRTVEMGGTIKAAVRPTMKGA